MAGSVIITAAYIAYAVVGIMLFFWRPPLQAALICTFGGWLLLPVAIYPAWTITAEGFTMEIIGTTLPSNLLITKTLRQGLITAITTSGLVLVPAAIFEGVHAPWFYSFIYGPHPFALDGVERYFGFRPLAFFERGNQYGTWIAMAALAAVIRALRSRPRSRVQVIFAGLLVACAIASQSVGAIILLVLGSGWLLAPVKHRRMVIIAYGLLTAIGGAAYLSGKLPLRSWALTIASGQKIVAMLHATERGLHGWRVQRDQQSLALIHQAPLTGYGSWDWWRPLESHPWGLPLLLTGQFGLIALALAAIALLAGALREMWQGSRSVLHLVVVLAPIDAWLNSFAYFPALLAAAAMADPYRRKAAQGTEPEHAASAAGMSHARSVDGH